MGFFHPRAGVSPRFGMQAEQAVEISPWQRSCKRFKLVRTDTQAATLHLCRRPLGFLNDLQ
ncbi:hypothetical protein Dret_1730 [Desulfohalobium retbaense DSM 5692]|uniref:Uncharacterized protein n=1 Tax=Desulfohalobium retbaense (strain ATCC 49708 / DSM 5692 / JCM 16813 / HR100) TaxID=485915 RepID=C8X3L7_DESRD|nr:hypothetical protein Dret_1730 [Desulfohalobium retbaense DSM 5692]